MNDIIEIGVYVTGDTWEVVAMRGDETEEPEPIWCENKAEALKEARALFNATPSAKHLKVENKRDCNFKIIRRR